MPNLTDLPANIQNFQHQYNRRNKFWRIFKVIFFAILVVIIIISAFCYTISPSHNSVLSSLGRLPVIKQFRQLVGLENLKGELDNRINFLILGQGGAGHEGPYLTDTIILASYKPSTNALVLISVPRDFYVELENYGWNRINTANSFGETNNYQGDGSAFTAKILEKIFNIPIHYWIRFDFKAFQEIIDNLNGVEICVDKSFNDSNYPTDDLKTEIISFVAGCQKMSGNQALKFARSRHGDNGEGSDFARSARQQKIIMAIKDKVFSLGFLTSPQKILDLYNTLKNNIQTNISLSQVPDFLTLAQKIKNENIKRIVLDNSAQSLLKADFTDEGAYVLLPRTGNYEELQNLAQNIFILKNGHETAPIRVVILNSTKIDGLARDTAVFLNSIGFEILKTGNASTTAPLEKTAVYNLKSNSYADILNVLIKSLHASTESMIPENLMNQIKDFSLADFLIVLGCPATDEECRK